jgi:hypothetical protein
MKTSSAALAADEASYVSSALGPSLYGFEIGNEVNNYKSTAVEATWSYANFKTQWESFYAAMSAKAPGAAFTGPAVVFNYTGYTVPFASDEGKKIVLLTEHYYRGNGAAAGSTLAQLLQPDPGLLTMLKAIGTAARSNAISGGIRLSEANSYFNGGASGVSNSYGTALWVLDFLFANAQNGSAGINFHGGGPGSVYSPIADTGTMVVGARPEFYALLLFSRAGNGPTYATKVTSNGGVDLSAYAIGVADGSTSIIVVNKDPAKAVRATIDVGKGVATAAVLRLLGPGLAATSGAITLGGDGVTPVGDWSPTEEAVTASGTTVTVDVSGASAVLVRAR